MKRGSGEFEETFLPYLDAAYNLARWLTQDPSDADDVVQESYMRAFRSFEAYRGGDSKSWILRIVRNTCYSWLQKNRPREIVYELNDEILEEKPGPETRMIEKAERQLLRREIKGLPPPFREVIVLRDIEGMSYKDIAEVIELPVGTVMSRLARGRERLQKSVEVYLHGGQI